MFVISTESNHHIITDQLRHPQLLQYKRLAINGCLKLNCCPNTAGQQRNFSHLLLTHYTPQTVRCADPGGCAPEGEHLLPLACWECGFESRRVHGVCLFLMSCVVRYRSLRRADHSSRGVLPSVVCLSVIVKPRQWGGHGPLKAVAPWKKEYLHYGYSRQKIYTCTENIFMERIIQMLRNICIA